MAFKKIAMMVSKINVKKSVLKADRKVMSSDLFIIAVMTAAKSFSPDLNLLIELDYCRYILYLYSESSKKTN